MNADERCAYVQIVGQVLIADGILADAEREYLDRLMDKLEMSPEDRATALHGIDLDSPVEERIATLSAESKQQLLTAVHEASHVDTTVTGTPAVVRQIEELLGRSA